MMHRLIRSIAASLLFLALSVPSQAIYTFPPSTYCTALQIPGQFCIGILSRPDAQANVTSGIFMFNVYAQSVTCDEWCTDIEAPTVTARRIVGGQPQQPGLSLGAPLGTTDQEAWLLGPPGLQYWIMDGYRWCSTETEADGNGCTVPKYPNGTYQIEAAGEGLYWEVAPPSGEPHATVDATSTINVEVRNLVIASLSAPGVLAWTPGDPSQTIQVTLEDSGPLTNTNLEAKIYPIGSDVAIKTINKTTSSSSDSLAWDGTDDSSSVAPKGLYRYNLVASHAEINWGCVPHNCWTPQCALDQGDRDGSLETATNLKDRDERVSPLRISSLNVTRTATPPTQLQANYTLSETPATCGVRLYDAATLQLVQTLPYTEAHPADHVYTQPLGDLDPADYYAVVFTTSANKKDASKAEKPALEKGNLLDSLIPPACTINQAVGQSDPTNASSINFTVVFSEPVTGFDSDGDVDTSLSTAGGTLQASITSVGGSESIYNVAISGMTAHGTVIASVPAGKAASARGIWNAPSESTDNEVEFDNICNPPSNVALARPLTTMNRFVVGWTPSPDNDIHEYQVQVTCSDGTTPVGWTSVLPSSGCTLPCSGITADATYTAHVYATDDLGNLSSEIDTAGTVAKRPRVGMLADLVGTSPDYATSPRILTIGSKVLVGAGHVYNFFQSTPNRFVCDSIVLPVDASTDQLAALYAPYDVVVIAVPTRALTPNEAAALTAFRQEYQRRLILIGDHGHLPPPGAACSNYTTVNSNLRTICGGTQLNLPMNLDTGDNCALGPLTLAPPHRNYHPRCTEDGYYLVSGIGTYSLNLCQSNWITGSGAHAFLWAGSSSVGEEYVDGGCAVLLADSDLFNPHYISDNTILHNQFNYGNYGETPNTRLIWNLFTQFPN